MSIFLKFWVNILQGAMVVCNCLFPQDEQLSKPYVIFVVKTYYRICNWKGNRISYYLTCKIKRKWIFFFVFLFSTLGCDDVV